MAALPAEGWLRGEILLQRPSRLSRNGLPRALTSTATVSTGQGWTVIYGHFGITVGLCGTEVATGPVFLHGAVQTGDPLRSGSLLEELLVTSLHVVTVAVGANNQLPRCSATLSSTQGDNGRLGTLTS
uniref:Uncharacterized protein n=1 Tax=Peronospora matthiolae TaxID=2874970 RepID=A0AAV1U5U0_9STRA